MKALPRFNWMLHWNLDVRRLKYVYRIGICMVHVVVAMSRISLHLPLFFRRVLYP